MSEVNISYKGSTIAGMDASGTKTLLTQGKYCEDNISVVYSKPAAPTPTLQSKTYTVDSAGTETITADSGYDGLSEVEVSVPSATPYIGDDTAYFTLSGQRKWRHNFEVAVEVSEGDVAGWLPDGYSQNREYSCNAIPTGTTVTPTESAQTIGGADYMMEGAVTVSAMPSGTAGTPTATKGTVSNHSISVTPSVTNTTGYITGSTKTGTAVTVSASELASGNKAITQNGTGIDVVGYSTVSVNVAGAEYTRTVVCPQQTVSSNSRLADLANFPDGFIAGDYYIVTYDGTEYLLTAETMWSSAQVVGDFHIYYEVPGEYLYPFAMGSSGNARDIAMLNTSQHTVKVEHLELITDGTTLTTKNITANGTYNASSDSADGYSSVTVNVSGGGTPMHIEDNIEASSYTSSTVTFTGLKGEPKVFWIGYDGNIATGTPSKVASIVFDGTSLHGQIVTNTSNAQASYSTAFTKSYSNGTLTITSSAASFPSSTYFLTYAYGGGVVDTKDVQVGSGATSITFTGLEAEPELWSCIFKSNFGTSSGYQRVMYVEHEESLTIGFAMDSQANSSASNWSYSYNNGSLTITSQGTNAGGYFHQPGYYQLTYAYDDGSGGGNYQSKTVTPTTSQQVVEADSGYDALEKVTVNAIPSEYIVPSGNINITSNTATGQTLNVAQYATATVAVPTGGANIATATMTNSSNQNTSIGFTLPSGRTPKAFFARLTSQIARNSNSRYYYVFDMRWDGSSTGGVAGNTFYMYSGTLTDVTSGYSYSQSGTTFTLSSTGTRSASPGSFYNGTYELVYIY